MVFKKNICNHSNNKKNTGMSKFIPWWTLSLTWWGVSVTFCFWQCHLFLLRIEGGSSVGNSQRDHSLRGYLVTLWLAPWEPACVRMWNIKCVSVSKRVLTFRYCLSSAWHIVLGQCEFAKWMIELRNELI